MQEINHRKLLPPEVTRPPSPGHLVGVRSETLRHDASQTYTNCPQSKTTPAIQIFEISNGVRAKMFFKDQTCLHCAGPPAPGRPVKFKLIALHRDINSDSSLRWPRGRRPCQHDKANALEAAGTARRTRQPGPDSSSWPSARWSLSVYPLLD